MKKYFTLRNLTLMLAIAGIYFVFLKSSYKSPFDSYKFSGVTMGTYYRAEIVGRGLDDAEIKKARLRTDLVLNRVDRIMSTYKPQSDISRFNMWESTDEMLVAAELADVTEEALLAAEEAGGAFDPTVGPLVELWGFGSLERPELPSQEQITELRKMTGYRKITVTENGGLKKSDPGVQLDLSAIAKGAGTDMAMAAFADMGFSNALIEVGGEIAAMGHNRMGRAWKISIERPSMDAGVGESSHAILKLNDNAVATSGDYRNYRSEEGSNYSHIIDPRTGWPVSNGVASVTVVADKCMTADALATALMVLGPEKGLELVEGKDGVEALIVVRSDSGAYLDHQSSGFDDFVYQKK